MTINKILDVFSPTKVGKRFINDIARSLCFMTLNIATVKYVMCLFLKFFKKYSVFVGPIAGGLGGIWSIFEPMKRRQQMAVFLLPKALEVSGRYLITRNYIKEFPYC